MKKSFIIDSIDSIIWGGDAGDDGALRDPSAAGGSYHGDDRSVSGEYLSGLGSKPEDAGQEHRE